MFLSPRSYNTSVHFCGLAMRTSLHDAARWRRLELKNISRCIFNDNTIASSFLHSAAPLESACYQIFFRSVFQFSLEADFSQSEPES